MSKGKLGRARYCPWCGTQTLERDRFNQNDTHHADSHISYLCTTCQTGFSLYNSPRVMFAHRMFADDRQLRPPEERIRQQLKIPQGGCPPLADRGLEDLERIESLLASKKPHTKTSKEHIAASLTAVRNEIGRRKHTTDMPQP